VGRWHNNSKTLRLLYPFTETKLKKKPKWKYKEVGNAFFGIIHRVEALGEGILKMRK